MTAAIAYGVVKTNIDSDAQHAYTRGIAGHILDKWDGSPPVDGRLGHKHAEWTLLASVRT